FVTVLSAGWRRSLMYEAAMVGSTCTRSEGLTNEGDSFHLLTHEFRLGFRTFCSSLFYVSTLASGHEELPDSFCLALFSLCVMSLTYWIVFLALFVHNLWYSVPAPFCLLKLSVRINAFDN
ncbi:unnamed protein product, partial [Ixodes pacificus]